MSSSINTAKEIFQASAIKGYKEMTFNNLMDGYCAAIDSNNKTDADAYMAGLALRFWSLISKTMFKHRETLKLDENDVLGGITDAIMEASKPNYRRWQTDKGFSAQTEITQIFNTRFVANQYRDINRVKNKGKLTEISLDTPISSEDDSITLQDTLEYPVDDYVDIDTKSIIQQLIDNDLPVNALILHKIISADVFKPYCGSFKLDEKKMISELADMDKDFLLEFVSEYNIETDILKVAYEDITKTTENRRKNLVKACLSYMKKHCYEYSLLPNH